MFLAVWWRRLVLFVRRDRARRELQEEMQLHLELRARAMQREGLTASDADAAARRRFGHEPSVVERSQDSWGFQRSDELRWNVRYAMRRLGKRPGYAATIMLVMGLGIGATTAMFSAVDATMLRALPFREPDRLVTLPNVELPFAPGPGKPADERWILDLPDVAAMPQLFSSVAAYAVGQFNLRDAERPLRVRVGVVTDAFFPTLGVDASVGRTFATEETVPGAGAVVILSEALWRREFASRAMLGKTILLDDQPYQVVGVMPRGFSFPQESDLWIPMSIPNTPAMFGPFGGYIPWEVVARLAPGIDVAAANARLAQRWRQTIDSPGVPPDPREARAQLVAEVSRNGAVRPFQTYLAGERAKALLVLFGATALLLLIACANVTNLLLSDAATRTREMALRTALGASRGRVFRQVLVESVILALGGVVTSLLLAPMVLRALAALMPAELAGVAAPGIDWRVLVFASSLGLVTGIGFGVWPARRASRTDPGETLKNSGNPLATGRRSARGSRILIAVEVALSLVLLIGSGLLLRSFARLMHVDRGMTTAQVASLELSFASSTPNAIRLANMEAMLERLRRSPGVESAAAVNDLPLGYSLSTAQGLDLADGAGVPSMPAGARYLLVSPGYFGTLGISLLRGRDFTPRDDSLAPPTVIINEALARRWSPNADPVGRHLTARTAPRVKLSYTVIGVVGNARVDDLATDVEPQIYHPVYRIPPTAFALVVRGHGKPEALLGALQNAVRAVDPSQAVGRARMMDDVVRESVAPRRTNVLLISLFAALALLLATLGVYSVVVHGVTQRSREFGIRTALGATGADLVGMVSREIFVVVAIGIAVGLAGAWAGVRLVESMVYAVALHDPASFTVGPVVLGAVAMTAALLPLRRVFSMNPVDVIRSE